MADAGLGEELANEREVCEVSDCKKLGAQSVIDIVGVVGDIIGNGGDLGLGAGERRKLEVLISAVELDCVRNPPLAVTGGGTPVLKDQRPIVLDQPFECLPGKIEPVKADVAPFERGHHPERLRVVIKSASQCKTAVERPLSCMTERWMTEVVCETQGFCEVLVETQGTGKRASNLCNLQRVREPAAVVVALMKDEHLRLVRQPAKGRRVNDAIAIAPKGVARGAWRLAMQPAAASARIGCVGRAGNCGNDSHAGTSN